MVLKEDSGLGLDQDSDLDSSLTEDCSVPFLSLKYTPFIDKSRFFLSCLCRRDGLYLRNRQRGDR